MLIYCSQLQIIFTISRNSGSLFVRIPLPHWYYQAIAVQVVFHWLFAVLSPNQTVVRWSHKNPSESDSGPNRASVNDVLVACRPSEQHHRIISMNLNSWTAFYIDSTAQLRQWKNNLAPPEPYKAGSTWLGCNSEKEVFIIWLGFHFPKTELRPYQSPKFWQESVNVLKRHLITYLFLNWLLTRMPRLYACYAFHYTFSSSQCYVFFTYQSYCCLNCVSRF